MQSAITKKNKMIFNLHQVVYSLSSISWPSLKLLAVTLFEISSFLCQSLQRAITKNWFFFNFQRVVYSLSSMSWPSLKLPAVRFFKYPDSKILKGHNSTKGDNPDFKKILVSHFLMLSPSMKFQNPILNLLLTDARTDARKMHLQLFQSWGA